MASAIGLNGTPGSTSTSFQANQQRQKNSFVSSIFDLLSQFFSRLSNFKKIFKNIKVPFYTNYLLPAIKFFSHIFKDTTAQKNNKIFEEKIITIKKEFEETKQNVFSSKYLFFTLIDLEKDIKKILTVRENLKQLNLTLAPFQNPKASLSKENVAILDNLSKDIKEIENEFAVALRDRLPEAFIIFREILDYLKLPIPESIRMELIDIGLLIKEVSKDRDYPGKDAFLKLFSDFLSIDTEEVESPSNSGKEPSLMKLSNIGNSCYIASALQALLNTQVARDLVKQTLTKLETNKHIPNELAKRKVIQETLINVFKFFDAKSKGNLSYLQYCLLLNPFKNSPLYTLRQAIFDSGLHPECNADNLDRQLDATSIVEVLMSDILNQKLQIQKVIALNEVPGRLKLCRAESYPTLQVDFGAKAAYQEIDLQVGINDTRKVKVYSLANLVDCELGPKTETDSFRFYPHEFEIVDSAKAENTNYDPKFCIKSTNYESQFFIRALPQVLAIQVKRFCSYVDEDGQTQSRKISDFIAIPPNGILDLSKHVKLKENDNVSKVYKLVGIILHSGGCGGGHYVAKFRHENGKYFGADDETVREIPPAEFYQEPNGYGFIFNRVD